MVVPVSQFMRSAYERPRKLDIVLVSIGYAWIDPLGGPRQMNPLTTIDSTALAAGKVKLGRKDASTSLSKLGSASGDPVIGEFG